MIPSLPAWLGYDPDRVAELKPAERRALWLSSFSALPGVVLIGLSAGYALFLASDLVWLGVCAGIAASFYLVNLLRVAVAGGGVGPDQSVQVITTWMPRSVPLFMLALLGFIFAQPLLFAGLSNVHEPVIAALRRDLGRLHRDATMRPILEEKTRLTTRLAAANTRRESLQNTLDQRRQELTSVSDDGRFTLERAVLDDERALGAQQSDVMHLELALDRISDEERSAERLMIEPYLRHLAQSHFLLRRVELTWERPMLALLFSLAMVGLMVLPWLASATVGRTAVRTYEARRWVANRALIATAYARARELEAQALRQWATFEGLRLELHEDAPYNTKPRAGGGTFEARHV